MKTIKIDTCASCPFLSTRTNKKLVLQIPFCTKLERELPYNVESKKGHKFAVVTDDIVQACPLDDA